jgi:uncharacterized protein (TIGR03083 family)
MVYAHKATIVEGDLQEPPQPWPPDMDIDDPLEFFDQQLQRVIEALRERDPKTPVWTWYPPEQTVGFWVRRMMQETVIHRADVESAVGQRPPISDEVAVDGIDELVERMLCDDDPEYYEGYSPGQGQRVAVTAADATWVITLGEQVASFSRKPSKDVDATLTGEAGAVLLAMWNRLPYTEITTTGDEAALAALRNLVAVATQ